MTSVTDLIRLKGKTIKVTQIINKAICSKCRCSEVPEYVIIYRGASEAAMLGALGRDGADQTAPTKFGFTFAVTGFVPNFL